MIIWLLFGPESFKGGMLGRGTRQDVFVSLLSGPQSLPHGYLASFWSPKVPRRSAVTWEVTGSVFSAFFRSQKLSRWSKMV